MRRGDVVTVALSGDYGKPRPAVVVQTDSLPSTHPSVIVCQFKSDLFDTPDIRITISPSTTNGLRVLSQIMADKPATVRRDRVGPAIGRLDGADLRRLDAALALVLGLSD